MYEARLTLLCTWNNVCFLFNTLRRAAYSLKAAIGFVRAIMEKKNQQQQKKSDGCIPNLHPPVFYPGIFFFSLLSSSSLNMLSHTGGDFVTSESLLFNCWHALPWVMKCIQIQGARGGEGVQIWHSCSPDALQLITLSNLVPMCRRRCRCSLLADMI